MTNQERAIVVAFLKALKELPESKKEYLLGFAEGAAAEDAYLQLRRKVWKRGVDRGWEYGGNHYAPGGNGRGSEGYRGEPS